MLRRIASYPEKFIHRSAESRGYRLEAAVVICCGLPGVLGMAYVGREALAAIPREAAMLRAQFIAEALFPVFTVLFLWVFYTVVAHLLSRHYGGRGPMGRLFRTAAWSLIPLGIWYLLRSIVVVALFLDVEFPAQPEGVHASEELAFILSLGLESPIYVATLLLGIPFVAWSGYLLSVGIEDVKDVSASDARKVAAVPSGAFAFYLLWRAVFWTGVL